QQETAEQFRGRLAPLEQRIKALSSQVDRATNRLKNMKQRLKTPSDEAREALNLNLAGHAMKTLLAVGPEGLNEMDKVRLMQIALSSGRLADVPPEAFPKDAFPFVFSAALGHYDAADNALAALALFCRRSPELALGLAYRGVELPAPPGGGPPALGTGE